MSLGQMADGAAGAANLALEVNGLRGPDQPKIDVIDIGGGLPVSWGAVQSPTFPQYAAELKQKAPELFDGTTFRRVVTEMGAMMNCRYAFFASLCEVTKPTDSGRIAMIHVGSEQFMRACHCTCLVRLFRFIPGVSMTDVVWCFCNVLFSGRLTARRFIQISFGHRCRFDSIQCHAYA